MTDMVEVSINGRWPLLLPEHRAGRPEWPWWEATRLAAMHEVIDTMWADRPVVFDVGSEEGDFPALWAAWGAGVVLAEPNPRVWPNIKAVWDANMERHGIVPPLMSWPGFIGAEPHLDHPRVTWPAWPACADGDVIADHGFLNLCERPDIPVTTVDLLADIHRPDVITIDVEGAELEVLKGARHTLAVYKPVVFCSVHPAFMLGMYQQSAADLYALMASHGYRRRHLCTDHETHEMFMHPDNMWFPAEVFETLPTGSVT